MRKKRTNFQQLSLKQKNHIHQMDPAAVSDMFEVMQLLEDGPDGDAVQDIIRTLSFADVDRPLLRASLLARSDSLLPRGASSQPGNIYSAAAAMMSASDFAA